MTTSSTTDALSPDEAPPTSRASAPHPRRRRPPRRSRRCTGRTVACPFENLDIALGRPIRLDRRPCWTRLSCPAGWLLLRVERPLRAAAAQPGVCRRPRPARVATAAGGLTDDFDHVALVVSGGRLEEPVLADVGFGEGFIEPLPLHDDVERRERGHTVGLARRDVSWVFRERRDGETGRTASSSRRRHARWPTSPIATSGSRPRPRATLHPVASRISAHPDRTRHPEAAPASSRRPMDGATSASSPTRTRSGAPSPSTSASSSPRGVSHGAALTWLQGPVPSIHRPAACRRR